MWINKGKGKNKIYKISKFWYFTLVKIRVVSPPPSLSLSLASHFLSFSLASHFLSLFLTSHFISLFFLIYFYIYFFPLFLILPFLSFFFGLFFYLSLLFKLKVSQGHISHFLFFFSSLIFFSPFPPLFKLKTLRVISLTFFFNHTLT